MEAELLRGNYLKLHSARRRKVNWPESELGLSAFYLFIFFTSL